MPPAHHNTHSDNPPDALANDVSRLSAAWRLVDAEELATSALVRHPRHAPLLYAHALTLLKQGRADESVDALKRAVVHHPLEANLQIMLAFALNYDPRASAADVAAAHLRAGIALRRAAGTPAKIQRAASHTGRPIRVGIVSSDLYRHSVAYFLEPLLERLPRERIEIVALNGSRASDDVTARLRGYAAEWHEMAHLGHEEFAHAARALKLDIALDLSGLTGGHRQKALAMRIAPVQALYMGYPHASGIDTMDARIADAITDPAGAPNTMGETIMRLPGCFLCYKPPSDAPEIAERSGKGVVFGCFGNLAKINRPLVRAWARVLAGVPGSRLLLKNHALVDERLRTSLVERLRIWGLEPARLDLRSPPPGEAEHLGVYNEIDVALDTFPYHGTTTTCEALLMGVPVVTYAGDRHVSRVGASLLAAAGCSDMCADDEDGFVVRAVDLGLAGVRRAKWRGALRESFAASALCDGARLGADFAAMLESLMSRSK